MKTSPKKQFTKKFKKVINNIHFFKEGLSEICMQSGAYNDSYPYYTDQLRKNVWKYVHNRVDSDTEAEEAWAANVNFYEVKLPPKPLLYESSFMASSSEEDDEEVEKDVVIKN